MQSLGTLHQVLGKRRLTDLLSLLLLRYEALIIGSTTLSTPCTFAVPWLQDKPTQFLTFCPLNYPEVTPIILSPSPEDPTAQPYLVPSSLPSVPAPRLFLPQGFTQQAEGGKDSSSSRADKIKS